MGWGIVASMAALTGVSIVLVNWSIDGRVFPRGLDEFQYALWATAATAGLIVGLLLVFRRRVEGWPRRVRFSITLAGWLSPTIFLFAIRWL